MATTRIELPVWGMSCASCVARIERGPGMLLWLARVARPYGFTREGIRRAGRALGRHALIVGIIYAATLGLTMSAYLLFQRLW